MAESRYLDPVSGKWIPVRRLRLAGDVFDQEHAPDAQFLELQRRVAELERRGA